MTTRLQAEEDVEYLRNLLKIYDEGSCTAGEVSNLVFTRNMEWIIQCLREQGRCMTVGNWCGPPPPPPETFFVKFSHGPAYTDICRTDSGQPLEKIEIELKYIKEVAVEAGLTCRACNGSGFDPSWRECPKCFGYRISKE